MKFFRKADEMEMYINLQALRFTYLFIMIFLAVRLVYLIVSNNNDPTIASKSWEFFLLITQNLVYFALHLILKRRMSR